MRALVTGGSGYLGSHVCKRLKQEGWDVVVYDIKKPKHEYAELYCQGDIRDRNTLDDLLKKVKFDVVFHFAGRIEVGESVKIPTEFYDVNTGGTCNLLNVMVKHGVQNIIYSSTAAVYRTMDIQLDEFDEVQYKTNAYAGSKLSAEYAIQQSGLKHIIFRYFNLAGADPDGEMGEDHEPETHLIPRIIQNLNNVEVYGKDYNTTDGTCVRDYVHVCDVAEAHIAAAKYLLDGKESNVLNLGTGKGYSVDKIVTLIEKIIGKQIDVKYLPRRPGDPAKLVANVDLAKKVLNYRPKHDIMSILQTAYNWHTK
jgi:UDP-glucose-4-epimerase GalE